MIPSYKTHYALSIAGSDPSGGAGIQCDLKTFMGLHVYGMAIPTLLTVQNTKSISSVHHLHDSLIGEQIEHLLDDITPHAIKIGAIGNAKQARAIVDALQTLTCPIVWDPVLVSSSGTALLTPSDIKTVCQLFKPLVSLATPNHQEVAYLKDFPNVLLTNGETDTSSIITDILRIANQEYRFTHPRFDTQNTHGTGCTLSSAITAFLAKGYDIRNASAEGIRYCLHLLSQSNRFALGHGRGGLGHEFSSVSFPK